jgi:hypothetical protein
MELDSPIRSRVTVHCLLVPRSSSSPTSWNGTRRRPRLLTPKNASDPPSGSLLTFPQRNLVMAQSGQCEHSTNQVRIEIGRLTPLLGLKMKAGRL